MVATHDLRIGDYIGGGFTPKGAVMGFRARPEDGELVLRAVDGGRRIAKGWGRCSTASPGSAAETGR